MPTRKEWKVVHADLMARLNLPCKLRFYSGLKRGRKVLGQHVWQDVGDYSGTHIRVCHINIDPAVDWKVPEHLILHEAAHHEADLFDEYHGHNEHWAKILFNMYEKTGITLPYSTGFETFARIARIEHKVFIRTPQTA